MAASSSCRLPFERGPSRRDSRLDRRERRGIAAEAACFRGERRGPLEIASVECRGRRRHERRTELRARRSDSPVPWIELRRALEIGPRAVAHGFDELAAIEARVGDREQAVELRRLRLRRGGGGNCRAYRLLHRGCGLLLGRDRRSLFGRCGAHALELRLEEREPAATRVGTPHVGERRRGRLGRIVEQCTLGLGKQSLENENHLVAGSRVRGLGRENREVVVERVVARRIGDPALVERGLGAGQQIAEAILAEPCRGNGRDGRRRPFHGFGRRRASRDRRDRRRPPPLRKPRDHDGAEHQHHERCRENPGGHAPADLGRRCHEPMQAGARHDRLDRRMLAQLDAAADRRLEQQARDAERWRLDQQAMNLTIRKKADELLRVAAIRRDQRDQVPRVLCEIADALIALLAEQRYVDQRDAAAFGFDRFDQRRPSIHRKHGILLAAGALHGCAQLRIGGQHVHVRAAGRQQLLERCRGSVSSRPTRYSTMS